jgi:exonuclease VII small subunit
VKQGIGYSEYASLLDKSRNMWEEGEKLIREGERILPRDVQDALKKIMAIRGDRL